jgi:hypothetical protein
VLTKTFADAKAPPEGPDPHGGIGPKGNMRIQTLRSSADWSHGSQLPSSCAVKSDAEAVLKEHSIMNAYIQLITEANHFVLIENQFFVTSTGKGTVSALAPTYESRLTSAEWRGSKCHWGRDRQQGHQRCSQWQEVQGLHHHSGACQSDALQRLSHLEGRPRFCR